MTISCSFFSVHSPLALAILSAKQAVFPQSNSTTQLTPQCDGSGAFLGLVRWCFWFSWAELGTEPPHYSCWANTGREASQPFFIFFQRSCSNATPVLKKCTTLHTWGDPSADGQRAPACESHTGTGLWTNVMIRFALLTLCNSSSGNAQKLCSSCSLSIHHCFTETERSFLWIECSEDSFK